MVAIVFDLDGESRQARDAAADELVIEAMLCQIGCYLAQDLINLALHPPSPPGIRYHRRKDAD
ncbi:MAG TPA: hypothetical protein VGH38_26975 [Bryobacteraceae bacterium]